MSNPEEIKPDVVTDGNGIRPDELIIYDTPRNLEVIFQRMHITPEDMNIHNYKRQTAAYAKYDHEIPKIFYVTRHRTGKYTNVMFAMAMDKDKIYLTDLHGKFGPFDIDKYNECVDYIYKNLVCKFIFSSTDVRIIKYKDNISRFVCEETALKFNLWCVATRTDNFSMMGQSYGKWKDFLYSYVRNNDEIPLEDLKHILTREGYPTQKISTVIRLFIYGVDILKEYTDGSGS